MDNWSDSVPAPMDVNGMVVPLDTKELVYRGKTRKVCAFSYNTRYGCWGVYFVDSGGVSLSACAMPDSWEKLEEDARKAPREYVEGRGITAGRDGRVAAMTCDLVRRAKALSELQ